MILIRFILGKKSENCPANDGRFDQSYEFRLNNVEMCAFYTQLLPITREGTQTYVTLEVDDCSIHELGIGLSLFCDALRKLNRKLEPIDKARGCCLHNTAWCLHIRLHLTIQNHRQLAIDLLKDGLFIATYQDDFYKPTLSDSGLVVFDDKPLKLLVSNDFFTYSNSFQFGLAVTVRQRSYEPNARYGITRHHEVRVQDSDVVSGVDYIFRTENKEEADQKYHWLCQEPLDLSHELLEQHGFRHL